MLTLRTLDDFKREALAAYKQYATGKVPMPEFNDPVLEAAFCTAMYRGTDATAKRLSKSVPDTDMEMDECDNDPKSSLYVDCCRKVLYRHLTDYLDDHLQAAQPSPR
jgi:hypothetical protein